MLPLSKSNDRHILVLGGWGGHRPGHAELVPLTHSHNHSAACCRDSVQQGDALDTRSFLRLVSAASLGIAYVCSRRPKQQLPRKRAMEPNLSGKGDQTRFQDKRPRRCREA